MARSFGSEDFHESRPLAAGLIVLLRIVLSRRTAGKRGRRSGRAAIVLRFI
jgi:hypothetical protein